MAVCGFLGHMTLAYGSVAMDRDRAVAAVNVLARRMGLGVRQTAEAIIQVAVSNMFVEVNKLVARYGIDPRDFTLLPFGGAGPMLGCLLARELGMTRVMIPRQPGVVSALGGLIADVKNDFVRTVFIDVEPAAAEKLRAAVAALRTQADAWLRNEQHFSGTTSYQFSADMRYRGQSFEIDVPLDTDAVMAADMVMIADSFHRQHSAIYDFADEAADVQLVNLRLVVAGTTAPPNFATLPRAENDPIAERVVTVWYDGMEQPTPLFVREALLHGHRFCGPAIVAQEDATVCIPAGFGAEVDAYGNLHLIWQA
jgi:N-methylhydantoinase A